METPIIIFPSYLGKKQVDPCFQDEYNAAIAAGFECYFVEISNNFHLPICLFGKFENNRTAIYRGWMLDSKHYGKLYYELSQNKNVILLNSKIEYENAHHFPNFYSLFNESTMASVVTGEKKFTKAFLKKVAKQLDGEKIFIKDWVKSEPDNVFAANDLDGGLEVIGNFVKNRGENLEGGLVFRNFVPLSQFEYRYWVLNGEILDFNVFLSPTISHDILKKIRKVKSNFFTIDLARKKESDEIIVVEIGDGQVSGLKGLNPIDFYQTLKHGHTSNSKAIK